MCAAQVCAQIGAYTWPALLPEFIRDWGLSNSEAGWITGVFYAAYTVAVPVLVTLTGIYLARVPAYNAEDFKALQKSSFAPFLKDLAFKWHVGEVLLDLGGETAGLGFAELDPERITEIRAQLPSLANRREIPKS